ncbi:MAG: STAS domain-containing protein [Candidatus Cloacimonetes bacterium]|nr:STAS domain-containing protein [Candidatus Cloacimonadota bacterium]
MEIKQDKHGDVAVLNLIGRLDANTSGELEAILIPMIDEGEKKIILDFSALEYISSAGLRLLLLAAKKLRNIKGEIVLCSMKDFIKEIFEISGFTPIFTIVDTKEDALKALE